MKVGETMAFQIGTARVERGEKARGWLTIAEATTHEVKLPYIIINGAGDGPTVTVLSGVHAIESAPVEATLRVVGSIEPEELRGTLVVLPVVNTEGFHARKPYGNVLDNLNQNKVFPGDPEGTITRRVAHAVFESFVSKSHYLVDCHSADLGEDATRLIFIFRTDDEELTRRMVEMARCFRCDFIETTNIAGNTGEAVNLYGIPCVMTESGTPFHIREEDIRFHQEGITNLLRHLGMLEGDAILGDPPVDPPTRRLWSEHAGIWRRKVEAGQRVKEGEKLGEVLDLLGEVRQVAEAPFDGTVSFLRIHYSVNQGDTLLWLASC